MRGTVTNIIEKSKRAGGFYWNVIVEPEDQPGKFMGYNCFDNAITGMLSQVIEYTVTPPKVGTTPILRLAGIMREPYGGRPGVMPTRPSPVTPEAAGYTSRPSARKEGREESFAASYAKDITVAMIAHAGTKDTVFTQDAVDAMLEHYFEWFLLKLKSTEEAPF